MTQCRRNHIYSDVLEAVGNTPVVRLNRFGSDLPCELVAKVEFFNAGGSVKDRIGKRMVDDALASGRIKVGDTLIEPTSGNTGIGMAMAAAVRGLKMVIVMPEKMSKEKEVTLKALGAEIVRTPTEAAWDSPDSHIGVAARLQKELPNAHILDQYKNPSNPLAHYEGTAEEILAQCDGKLDMVVLSAGTGGTVSGTAKKLKEKLPNLKVIGVDPHGSLLADDKHPVHGYEVEGIGYDFVPDVLDRSVVDEWYKSSDKESFMAVRELIRDEGILAGGSSGSVLCAALHHAKELKEGQRCLVLLPDSIRNYMTKFVDDGWMVQKGFMDSSEVGVGSIAAKDAKAKGGLLGKEELKVSQIKDIADLPAPVTATPTTTVGDAFKMLKDNHIDNLPVVDGEGKVKGVVSLSAIAHKLHLGGLSTQDTVSKAMALNFTVVKATSSIDALLSMLGKEDFAVVVDDAGAISKVVTKVDVLSHLMHRKVLS